MLPTMSWAIFERQPSGKSNPLRLITAEGKALAIAKVRIEGRKRGASAMPADLIKKLSPRELRDLLEFLVVQPKWSEG